MKIAIVLVPLLTLSSATTGFAAAAATSATAASAIDRGMITVALNQRARFGRTQVTPARIEEDSRCPIGVQCVRAGTVRLAVRIIDRGARRDAVLTLGQPLRLVSGRWVTLAAVCPHPKHPVAVRQRPYRFTFLLASLAPAPPAYLSCEGRSSGIQ